MKLFFVVIAILGSMNLAHANCKIFVEESLATPEAVSTLEEKGYQIADVGLFAMPMYGWNFQSNYDASFDPVCGYADSNNTVHDALYLVGSYVLQDIGAAFVTTKNNNFPGVTLSVVLNSHPTDSVQHFFDNCHFKDVKFTAKTTTPNEILSALKSLPVCK